MKTCLDFVLYLTEIAMTNLALSAGSLVWEGTLELSAKGKDCAWLLTCRNTSLLTYSFTVRTMSCVCLIHCTPTLCRLSAYLYQITPYALNIWILLRTGLTLPSVESLVQRTQLLTGASVCCVRLFHTWRDTLLKLLEWEWVAWFVTIMIFGCQLDMYCGF